MPDLGKYDTAIIGFAIHGATPHPDVLAFVEKNRTMLKEKRTAVLSYA
ncbi:MAG: flavodoxin domain-containing protein [Spirochaetia bacterium]|nr:flavodoxin domain-containing protein [Spirochaetia bacterium]